MKTMKIGQKFLAIFATAAVLLSSAVPVLAAQSTHKMLSSASLQQEIQPKNENEAVTSNNIEESSATPQNEATPSGEEKQASEEEKSSSLVPGLPQSSAEASENALTEEERAVLAAGEKAMESPEAIKTQLFSARWNTTISNEAELQEALDNQPASSFYEPYFIRLENDIVLTQPLSIVAPAKGGIVISGANGSNGNDSYKIIAPAGQRIATVESVVTDELNSEGFPYNTEIDFIQIIFDGADAGGGVQTSGDIVRFDHCQFVNTASGMENITNSARTLSFTYGTIMGGRAGVNGGGKVTLDQATLSNINGPAINEVKDLSLYSTKILNCFPAISILNGFNSVSIANVDFIGNSNNHSGGAIAVDNLAENASLTIANSYFAHNTVTGENMDGGAVFAKNLKGKYNIISNCWFYQNTSSQAGGAIALEQIDGRFRLVQCMFEENTNTDKITGVSHTPTPLGNGGAFSLYNNENVALNLLIKDSAFKNNSAYGGGGAVFWQSANPAASLNLVTNTFVYNQAQQVLSTTQEAGGGAVHLALASNATIIHNTFFKNSSGNSGGALGVYSDAPQAGGSYRRPTINLTNNLFVENIAQNPAGSNITNVNTDPTGAHSSAVTAAGNVGLDNGTPLVKGLSATSVFGSEEAELIEASWPATTGSAWHNHRTEGMQLKNHVPGVANPGTWADSAGVPVEFQWPENETWVWLGGDQRGGAWGNPPSAGSMETTFTVTFDSNGGSELEDAYPLDFMAGNPIFFFYQPTPPTKEGFTFGGWCTDPAGKHLWRFITNPEDEADLVVEDTILYAKWIPDTTYTVTFNSNGGSTVAAVTDVWPGALVTMPQAPTKSSYTFGGWFKEETLQNEWNFETDTITGNITLFAKWVPVAPATYTVTFNSNGGSAVNALTGLVAGAKVPKPSNPTKSSYTFGGWFKEETLQNEWNFETDTITGNITLFAKWVPVAPATYTVTFNSNGGSAVNAISGLLLGVKISQPVNPSREGYYFGGWFKNTECTEVWDFTLDTIPGNITLYAKWVAQSTSASSSAIPVSSSSSPASSSKPKAPVSSKSDSVSSASPSREVGGSSSVSSQSSSKGLTSASQNAGGPVSSASQDNWIHDGTPPLGNLFEIAKSWALVDLLIAILMGVISLGLIISGFVNHKEGNNSKKGTVVRILGVVVGLIAVSLFPLTQNMQLPMGFVDAWTIVMALLLAVQIATAFIAARIAGTTKE